MRVASSRQETRANCNWRRACVKLGEYLGLAQQFVADQTGIPRMAISAFENGRRRVEALELERLAALYRRPVAHFLGVEEEVPATVQLLAREAAELSERDRAEVLRFAQFLKSYGGGAPGTAVATSEVKGRSG